jgi:NTE family protein
VLGGAGRALVLGGGGVTGIAWELGVLAGLRDAGADLTSADLIIGTSAGAFVGALVATGVDLGVAVTRLGEVQLELPARLDLAALAAGFAALTDRSVPAAQARARIGAIARGAPVGDAAGHVALFTVTLPRHEWPTRPRLVVTGIDTVTGELAAWDAAAGVPLPEAVAASCAVPGIFPPVDVGGTGYFMDGGTRSVANADLAAGADAVVVLAPTEGVFRTSPADQVASLNLARSRLIAPDEAALAAIGTDMLDPGRREPALIAGMAQGRALAAEVARIWNG